MIFEDGSYAMSIAGRNFSSGEIPQILIPGGTWFAAELTAEEGYALAGCTVAPGFDFADFELADRDSLSKKFPLLSDIICRLTKD